LELLHRVASLIRNRHPPNRAGIGPYAQAYCRVLERGVFLRARYSCTMWP